MSYVWDCCLPLVLLLTSAIADIFFQAEERYKTEALLSGMEETSLTDCKRYFQNKVRDLSPLIAISILPQIATHLLILCEHSQASFRLCWVKASAFCASPSLAAFDKSLLNPCCREV